MVSQRPPPSLPPPPPHTSMLPPLPLCLVCRTPRTPFLPQRTRAQRAVRGRTASSNTPRRLVVPSRGARCWKAFQPRVSTSTTQMVTPRPPRPTPWAASCSRHRLPPGRPRLTPSQSTARAEPLPNADSASSICSSSCGVETAVKPSCEWSERGGGVASAGRAAALGADVEGGPGALGLAGRPGGPAAPFRRLSATWPPPPPANLWFGVEGGLPPPGCSLGVLLLLLLPLPLEGIEARVTPGFACWRTCSCWSPAPPADSLNPDVSRRCPQSLASASLTCSALGVTARAAVACCSGQPCGCRRPGVASVGFRHAPGARANRRAALHPQVCMCSMLMELLLYSVRRTYRATWAKVQVLKDRVTLSLLLPWGGTS